MSSNEEEIKRIKAWIEERRKLAGSSPSENGEKPESHTEAKPEIKGEEKADKPRENMPPDYDSWPEDIKKAWKQERETVARFAKDDKQGLQIKRYLDYFEKLPWKRAEKKEIDIARARQVLDRDHYGLETVKNAILEYLAVRKISEGQFGSVMLLVGPPGIGKTSLARSIAEALERPFGRINMGGMTDELTLKGSDRAYMNAFPGAVIKNLIKCGSSAPVILLDEVDKIPPISSRGDCGSILLELLDSGRKDFTDNYLQVPFDLTDVFFICTANDEEQIAKPLLDRMELIRLPGYSGDEKFHIAKRHVVPKTLKEAGMEKHDFCFTDDAIGMLVEASSSSKGVRELERLIFSVCRRAALLFVEEQLGNHTITEDFITEQDILSSHCTARDKRIGFSCER